MNKRSKISLLTIGCLALLLTGIGLQRSLRSFDAYRDQMLIRKELIPEDVKFRYSPGFDWAMWCRFTVKAESIDKVFESNTGVSEFTSENYQFQVATVTDEWWDVDLKNLTGGEVEVGEHFMRVGYVDNGDGTLTVYIYFFEV